MRTTLDIDPDVLGAVKTLARRESKTAGQVLSELARIALTRAPTVAPNTLQEPPATYGFAPFPHRGAVVSNELVDQLRDQDSY
jgi:hypothetical protein